MPVYDAASIAPTAADPEAPMRTTRPVLSGLVRLLGTASGAAMLVTMLAGCPRGDVGAPCNHGDVEPPESKLVTFPALTCNDLLCVYADEDEPPGMDCTPGGSQCNDVSPNPAANKFECVPKRSGGGKCQLRMDYVLSRSMCSKKCDSDSDCKDGGPTQRNLAKETSCSGKFKCARIQTLGEFCCQKMCVCEDDLGVTTDIDMKCANLTQEGCCDQDPVPEACGKQ